MFGQRKDQTNHAHQERSNQTSAPILRPKYATFRSEK